MRRPRTELSPDFEFGLELPIEFFLSTFGNNALWMRRPRTELSPDYEFGLEVPMESKFRGLICNIRTIKWSQWMISTLKKEIILWQKIGCY